MNTTIKDVAKFANVSISTVSRVSSGGDGVSAKTRRHILRVIKELGYSPSAMASGLKTRLSKSIGIAVPDTMGDFYGEIINGIETVILFIQDVPYIDSSKERFYGYKRALKDNKIKFSPDFILSGDFTVDSGYLSVEKYLNKYGLNFSAIFATNDQMAIGAIKALNDKNIIVPNDISIVGFDDSYISPYVIPPLTTIKQGREEMGKVATQLLLDRIVSQNKKERTPRQIIIPVELVKRESAISLSSIVFQKTRSLKIKY